MNITRISQLLIENDLSSKHELIKLFKSHLELGSQDELHSLLMNYSMTNDAAQRISNFDTVRLYGPRSGLSRYVANQLLLSLNVQSAKNKISVLKQLDIALNNLYRSKNPLLKLTKAKLVIDLLQNFFGVHFHKIVYHRFLSIYFVPFENKRNNAAFDINTNSIAVFRTKEKKTQTPEYILLHEFGHVLHCSVFKTIKEVPKSFVDFNQKMNANFFNYSKEDQLEIYADLFSIAVMLDTEFEDYNPFIKTMKRQHTDKIKEYFLKELSTLDTQSN
jgi:hypothetical protein